MTGQAVAQPGLCEGGLSGQNLPQDSRHPSGNSPLLERLGTVAAEYPSRSRSLVASARQATNEP